MLCEYKLLTKTKQIWLIIIFKKKSFSEERRSFLSKLGTRILSKIKEIRTFIRL